MKEDGILQTSQQLPNPDTASRQELMIVPKVNQSIPVGIEEITGDSMSKNEQIRGTAVHIMRKT